MGDGQHIDGHDVRNDRPKRKLRILIAEDEPVSGLLLKRLLTNWDYEVTVATDGTQALQVLETAGAPRLAVLDWMMPGMEGVQVCQRIREWTDRPYTYVLLLTARTDKQDLLRGLDLGADDYLTKPFDAQELRARLHVGQRVLDLQDRLLVARDQLQFRATHDSLTGLANRAAMIEAVEREHARQQRSKGSFGLIMADLDHFKSVNDTHGHLAGDTVLKEVAKRMKECARAYDTVGRYGGEEFLIVVAAADEMATLGLAERMRAAIEMRPFVTDSGDLRITASFGATASRADAPLDTDALIQVADDALYRAKLHGRNRCELAVPAGGESGKKTDADEVPIKSKLA